MALGALAGWSPTRRLLGRVSFEVGRALAEQAGSEPTPIADALPVAVAPDDWRQWQMDEQAPLLAGPDRPALEQLNVLCSMEAWQNETLVATMRRQLPDQVRDHPEFPRALEHRKHWEFAHCVVGLEQLGALGAEAFVLGVGAGHEAALYDLTTRARWVFGTDIYGGGFFSTQEADAQMLVSPDHFAACQYNRRRLVVEHMDALDLRFEDATFEVAYSLSSVEHFGGLEGARAGLSEMARVLKPGGIAAVTTECVVNGAAAYLDDALALFTPEDLQQLFTGVAGLQLVEPLDLTLSAATAACEPIPLQKALEDATVRRHVDYPHVLLEHAGRVYTSCAAFLRKDGAPGSGRVD